MNACGRESEGTVRENRPLAGEGGLKAFGHEQKQPVWVFQDVVQLISVQV